MIYRTAYRIYWRVGFTLSKALATVICESKIRRGRRRHDGHCDECDEPLEAYCMQKLDFPIESLEPDATTSREKLRAMLNAEYVRVCIECGHELEAEQ